MQDPSSTAGRKGLYLGGWDPHCQQSGIIEGNIGAKTRKKIYRIKKTIYNIILSAASVLILFVSCVTMLEGVQC